MKRVTLLAGVLLLGSTGCASTAFRPGAEAVGAYRSMEEVEVRARDDQSPAQDVEVLMGSLPPGVTYNNDVLQVDSDRYEVLAKVSAKPEERFFYPYKEQWRRPYCWPQSVLIVGTLFVWAAVPTAWPCFTSAGTANERRDAIVEAMRRATKAAGGNLVLVGGFGGTVVFNARNGATLSTTEVTHGVGWALRVKAPAAARARDGATPLPVRSL